jgi:acetyltransferase-like isoleucine patch superfamily enzyme
MFAGVALQCWEGCASVLGGGIVQSRTPLRQQSAFTQLGTAAKHAASRGSAQVAERAGRHRLLVSLRDEFGAVRWSAHLHYVVVWLLALCLPEYTLTRVRTLLYRSLGCDFAPGAVLQGQPRFLGTGSLAAHLHVGRSSIIAPRVIFGLHGDIVIGAKVAIAPHAALHTATHPIGFGSRRMGLTPVARPIVIEDGVWIGTQAIVLPGVHIGRGSVVAAGAVVADDVPPHVLVAGNPATVQATLPFAER